MHGSETSTIVEQIARKHTMTHGYNVKMYHDCEVSASNQYLPSSGVSCDGIQ